MRDHGPDVIRKRNMLTVTTEQEKALYLRPAGALRLRRPGSRCPRGARVEQLFVESDPQPAQAYAAAEFEAEIPQDLTTHKDPLCKGELREAVGDCPVCVANRSTT